MVIVLLTEERPEPEMATRLALLVLDLPLWNSEEDLAEARRKWRQGWRCWSWICPYGIQRRIWPRQAGNGDKAGAAGPGSAPMEFRGGFGRGKPEMATRLALLVLDLPLWNSEEDL